MSNLEFTICCTVTFFSKKRRTPPNLNNGKYCPHLVIKGAEQQLGVNEDIDYSALQVGTEFLIMDSGNVVGEGIVKEIFQHKSYGSK